MGFCVSTILEFSHTICYSTTSCSERLRCEICEASYTTTTYLFPRTQKERQICQLYREEVKNELFCKLHPRTGLKEEDSLENGVLRPDQGSGHPSGKSKED